LSQFGGRGRRKAYREKVQGYGGEEKRIFEDLRHGFLLGGKEFIERMRMRYLGKGVNREIPQQRKVMRDRDLKGLVKRATTFLGINLEGIEGRRRVRGSDDENRDLLIYLFWEDGRYRGQEIGDMFGLGYSSVCQREAGGSGQDKVLIIQL